MTVSYCYPIYAKSHPDLWKQKCNLAKKKNKLGSMKWHGNSRRMNWKPSEVNWMVANVTNIANACEHWQIFDIPLVGIHYPVEWIFFVQPNFAILLTIFAMKKLIFKGTDWQNLSIKSINFISGLLKWTWTCSN